MSISLLSSSGTQAINNFTNTKCPLDTKYGQTYGQILAGIATANSYTNNSHGMSSSIFNLSSGLSSQTSSNNAAIGQSNGMPSITSSNYTSNYATTVPTGSSTHLAPNKGQAWQPTGSDGLNRRGAITRYQTNRNSVSTAPNPFLNGSAGSSVMANFYASIQSVSLGQYAPTSVFEQRLNYHLDYADQRKPGESLSFTESHFDSRTSTSNIFSDTSTGSGVNGSNLSKAATASSVSQLMSLLG